MIAEKLSCGLSQTRKLLNHVRAASMFDHDKNSCNKKDAIC